MEVKIEGIYKAVSEHFCLKVELALFPSGSISGLIGDNGRGKTTLLKIIAGLDPEFKGIINYDNSNLTSDIRKQITMTFQTPMLLNRTVYHNIEYPMKIRKIPTDMRHKNVVGLMEQLGITHLSKKNATRLSGGESQRLALARALALKPKLLLLDELFSSIDINSIQELERCIIDYNKKTGASIILVTHNHEQLKRICNNIVNL